MYKLKGCLINVLLVLFLFVFFGYSGLYYSAEPSQIINEYKIQDTSYTFIIKYNLLSKKILLYYRRPMQLKDIRLAESTLSILTTPDNNDYKVVVEEKSVRVIINGSHDRKEVFDIQFIDPVTFTHSKT